jgi:hypothetical protein
VRHVLLSRDSDDYVPHGPGDRADSFDNAGSIHVALAAARPVHSRRHSASGPGHGSYRPALEYGNDPTGKIAQAVDPARPDMDEACESRTPVTDTSWWCLSTEAVAQRLRNRS